MKFKTGDKVTFTLTTKKANGYRMQSKEGVIHQIINDNVAVVKYRNGKKVAVSVSDLRKKGERTELTEQVMKMGEAYK